jgi:hypothetical protein
MGSLVIFSVNVRRLASFYEAVLGARPIVEPSGDIRLLSDREEILIHSIPSGIDRRIEITSPPEPREDSPLKPVFDVDSLDSSLEVVRTAGGTVTDRAFSIDGLHRHDVIDPDGNVIQLQCQSA